MSVISADIILRTKSAYSPIDAKEARSEEVMAASCQAQILKTLDGKIQIRGGSAEEQAREWQEMFLATAHAKQHQVP